MGMTNLPASPHLATSDDAVGNAAYPIAGRFRLADGRLVRLRPLQAEDAPRLMDLCKRLSPSTLRRRFLRSVVRCDPLEAQRLAAVDQVQRVAFVAVPDPADDPPIVAVGRFHGDGSERAELALVVDDAYQRVGLGRLLLSRLLREAVQRRLRVLEGYVLYDNAPMLRLLRTSGQPLEVRWDAGDVLSVQLAVPGYATAAELLPVPTKK
jgi:GNAT superfamily N-acetyltransferase